MLGKTHLTVGVAASLTILQPESLPELVVGISVAAIGALISDIDIDSTQAHRNANLITAGTVMAIAAVALVERYLHIGITQYLLADSNITRIIIGTLAFILLVAFGKQTKHRTFMHSLLALVGMSFCLSIFSPLLVPYFAVAFISHIVIDILNFKRVKILYPYKKGIAFKLCHSDGIVNSLMFLAGVAVIIIQLIISIFRIIF